MHRAIVFILLALTADAYSSYPPASPYVTMKGRLQRGDVCFAGLVIADDAQLPQKDAVQGAHRVVTIRPLLALRGDLPAVDVKVVHSHSYAMLDAAGRPISWTYVHAREAFVLGAVYFFWFAEPGKSDRWVFDGALESSVKLDDPEGKARKAFEEAFERAGIRLPGAWQRELDAASSRARKAFELPFDAWCADADAIVFLSDVKKGKPVVSSPSKAPPPEEGDLETSLFSTLFAFERGQRAAMNRMRRSARDGRAPKKEMVWRKDDASRLLGWEKHHRNGLYAWELSSSSNVLVRCDGGATWVTQQDVTVHLAFSPSKASFKNADIVRRKRKEGVWMVPVTFAEGGVVEASAEPRFIEVPTIAQCISRYEAAIRRLNDMNFLVRLFGEPSMPTGEEWARMERLLGKKYDLTREGRRKAATYWMTVIRPQWGGASP